MHQVTIVFVGGEKIQVEMGATELEAFKNQIAEGRGLTHIRVSENNERYVNAAQVAYLGTRAK